MTSRPVPQLPLIVIVGPTASGKTTLSIELAGKFDGEIICADSRTVYRGMDIGTAKPTAQEQALVPHWGIDLVEPGESFNAADFKAYAIHKIDDIRARGKIPFLVGGTGLYVDAVVFDYDFGPVADPVRRKELEELSLQELHEYSHKNNIILPENLFNKRYVIRAIERKKPVLQRRRDVSDNIIIVGIATDKEILMRKIHERAEHIFEHNVVNEATMLGKKYGWTNESMTGSIYPIIHRYLSGELSLTEAKYKFTTSDWQLAKRQLTWFRRNSYIMWLAREEILPYINTVLVSE